MKPGRAPIGSRLDAALYPLFAGGLTLVAACLFFSSLKLQLFYSTVRGDPMLTHGWSAPLDDVFIHFDFARAVARGYPFQWSEGNGYSSGGTSLLYPFVLALGYLSGFRDTSLMEFSGVVAAVSVFALLLAARRLFRDLPPYTKYFAPCLLLSVGALNWTLWSGMEVAFFLGVWGAALVAWDDLVRGPPEAAAPPSVARAALLGFCCAVLVATRPEAFVLVAVFSLSASWAALRAVGRGRGVSTLLWTGVPGALVLTAQLVANRVLTGDFSAAGALVKLELNDPRLSGLEVFDAWTFHVIYQVGRVSGHHLAGNPYLGAVLWGVCAVPFFSRRTRLYAALLWASAILWVFIVALNGQVRWQNERYTMPALAFLLLSAALGLGVLCSVTHPDARRAPLLRAAAMLSTALFALGLYTVQRPRFRDQLWFFGRASRNIFEQHVKAARVLRRLRPPPRRVVLGDAGAIPFESDLPALDIIGLGGYSGLPFARATRWGIASAVELIERMPPDERPDVMALYPTWWGDFPLWFGRPFGSVPVRGNVICGGAEKVLYEADFSPLDRSAEPVSEHGAKLDTLDFADVISEREHGFALAGAVGFVTMKILPHPREPEAPLWDAGRIVPQGAVASFDLGGLSRGRPSVLLLRVAPPQRATLRVSVDGEALPAVVVEPCDSWKEVPVAVPASPGRSGAHVSIAAEQGEVILYHLWAVEGP